MAYDRNASPVTSENWSLAELKTVTFDGGTVNVTSGVITFYCNWFPLGPNSKVTAA